MADLIVLCPGALVAPVGPRAPGDPAWPRWLAHGRPAGRADDPDLIPAELPHEAWLRRYFGLDPASSVEAATASIDLATPPLPSPGQPAHDQPIWRLTPVRLRLGVDHLVLDDPAHLSLTSDDSDQLAGVAQPVFAQAGFELLAPTPGRWYLRSEHCPDWTPRGWRMAVGRNIDAYSPQGTDARLWRRLVNEVQMSWHDHPVNQAREAAGLAPVNSLWLDGRFMLHQVTGAARPLVICDDPALLGLATATAGPRPINLAIDPAVTAPLPSHARAAVQAAAHDLLLTCPAWRNAEHDGSGESWRQAWQQFSQWLAPFAPDGRPAPGYQRLRLVLCGDRRWVELDLLPGGRWAWWRRSQPDTLLEHRNP